MFVGCLVCLISKLNRQLQVPIYAESDTRDTMLRGLATLIVKLNAFLESANGFTALTRHHTLVSLALLPRFAVGTARIGRIHPNASLNLVPVAFAHRGSGKFSYLVDQHPVSPRGSLHQQLFSVLTITSTFDRICLRFATQSIKLPSTRPTNELL